MFLQALFPPQSLANVLGEVVADAGRTQLRMAETEKYPHVTYFFNGGRETPYPGEDRIMVPSPKVATYDLQPEMSAPELTDKAVEAIRSGQYDLIVLNFANPDMVGPYRQPAGRHQGGRDGGCGPRPHRRGGAGGRRRAARHRRPRQLRADARPGHRRAAHGAHHQPGAGVAGRRRGRRTLADGRLADIAPTLLALMGLPQPARDDGRLAAEARPLTRCHLGYALVRVPG